MKHTYLFLCAVLMLLCTTMRAQEEGKVWKAGEALITDASQITATAPHSSQFPASNLIRPESDGVGTNQYIYHTAAMI